MVLWRTTPSVKIRATLWKPVRNDVLRDYFLIKIVGRASGGMVILNYSVFFKSCCQFSYRRAWIEVSSFMFHLKHLEARTLTEIREKMLRFNVVYPHGWRCCFFTVWIQWFLQRIHSCPSATRSVYTRIAFVYVLQQIDGCSSASWEV